MESIMTRLFLVLLSINMGFSVKAVEPFDDATGKLGLAGGLGGGAGAWGDFNNDGWVDLYVQNRLWRNEGGVKFTQVKDHGIVGNGGLWGDYNNDGLLDLYVWGTGNLYRNVDGKSFVDETAKQPKRIMPVSRGACWGDFDGDGFIDLYIGGYEKPGYHPDAIYHNNGDGTFSFQWKTPGTIRPARGITAADFDDDGDLDVYVSNYRIAPNMLWQNDGKGVFKNVADTHNAAGDHSNLGAWGHTIGSCFGDLDNDGLLDIFVGNFSHPPAYQDRPMFLRNMGPKHEYHFEDMSKNAGLVWQESFGSPTLGDFDNDGHVDFYYTTVYGGDHSVLYRNNSKWSFSDVTTEAGIPKIVCYQAAWADFDNDGDLDLLSGGILWRNTSSSKNKNHWLKIKMQGGGKINQAAIGTVVRIKLTDQILTRQVSSATGEGNQNDLTLHFGLGAQAEDVELAITWPGGAKQSVTTSVDKALTIKYAP